MLTTENYQRLKRVFYELGDLGAEEQARLLGETFAAEPVLLVEAQSLLAFARSMGRSPQAREALPERIGHYAILEEVGRGGMGIVYLARQTGPVQRLVALKVPRPDIRTKDFVARFEQERQVLAVLNHPSIPKVYDAGATEDGVPFFSMEFVDGLPITEASWTGGPMSTRSV